MIEGARDVSYLLGWDPEPQAEEERQRKLFHELSDQEEKIIKILQDEGDVAIDRISLKCNIPVSRIPSVLLGLELAGLIKCLPGDVYCTV